ncbi:Hypothetical predicted protein [Pelobates cultripes]|uniref:Uncharacterized protein n=1 Tax=Pelobates cultripes TaxID=61616 RepID=A0AAD1RNY1_PELCU|nr:Hypothetical predicted protein [Pelobates cultripes]
MAAGRISEELLHQYAKNSTIQPITARSEQRHSTPKLPDLPTKRKEEGSPSPAIKPPATGAPCGGQSKMADSTWLPAPNSILDDILTRLDILFLKFWRRLESKVNLPDATQPNTPLHQSLPRKVTAPHWRKDPPQRLLKQHTQPKRRTKRTPRSTRKSPQRVALPKARLTAKELLHYHQAPAGNALRQLTGRLAHQLPRGGIG